MATNIIKSAGDRLVDELSEVLGDSGEWSERERSLLNLVHDQADDLARLEGLAADADPGSAAGARIWREIRLSRAALARLIGLVGVPDEFGPAPAVKNPTKQRAAMARWDRQRRGNA